MKSDNCLANVRPDSDKGGFETEPTRNQSCSDFFPIVVLAVGDGTIGVPKSALLGILPLSGLIPCGSEPAWLLGIGLVNGGWLPVISMEDWLWEKTSFVPRDAKVAVLECDAAFRIGLLIDNVIGYRDVFESEIAERVRPTPGAKTTPVHSIARDNLQLIDVSRILAHPALAPEALGKYFLSG